MAFENVKKLSGGAGLEPSEIKDYTDELSGRKLQRVAICQDRLLRPDFSVTDGSVSVLDASIRTKIINFMTALQRIHGLTYLYIAYDVA